MQNVPNPIQLFYYYYLLNFHSNCKNTKTSVGIISLVQPHLVGKNDNTIHLQNLMYCLLGSSIFSFTMYNIAL